MGKQFFAQAVRHGVFTTFPIINSYLCSLSNKSGPVYPHRATLRIMTKANARSGEREIKYLQIGQLLEAKNVFLFARVLFYFFQFR